MLQLSKICLSCVSIAKYFPSYSYSNVGSFLRHPVVRVKLHTVNYLAYSLSWFYSHLANVDPALILVPYVLFLIEVLRPAFLHLFKKSIPGLVRKLEVRHNRQGFSNSRPQGSKWKAHRLEAESGQREGSIQLCFH